MTRFYRCSTCRREWTCIADRADAERVCICGSVLTPFATVDLAGWVREVETARSLDLGFPDDEPDDDGDGPWGRSADWWRE